VNAPLRRIAVAVMVLFGVLFVNLNYVQFVKGDYYRNHPRNTRVLVQEYQRQRGNILAGRDVVAMSEDTGGELRFTRRYPMGPQFAPIVGFKSIRFGETGMEAKEDELLSGDDPRLFVRRVSDILTGRQPVGGDVVLTLSTDAQKEAYSRLNGAKGAVVALDPTTGAVLAAVSSPSFDPNPLASHKSKDAAAAWNAYLTDPNKPLVNRALGETYPPGSTFKTIVAAAALKSGDYHPDTMIPAGSSYQPRQTSHVIRNAAPSICPESEVTLQDALRESCNTGFAQLGVRLGADKVKEMARAFGFEDGSLTIPLAVAPSRTGDMADEPSLAQSSIGQRDIRMTPLEGAMIAATVANDGRRMRPHLIKEEKGPDLVGILDTANDHDEMNAPLTPEQAGELRGMMDKVVESGTGTNAQIPGVEVGGKTGTAQNAEGANDHGWFIGYAIKDGKPVVAVAVFLERAGKGGSSHATEIGGAVMKKLLEERG
jgi:peptidoglycan glycosyltransferase